MARPKDPFNTLHRQCLTCRKLFDYEKRKPKTHCSKRCAANDPAVKEKNAYSVATSFVKKYGGHPMIKNEATREKFRQSMLQKFGPPKKFEPRKKWGNPKTTSPSDFKDSIRHLLFQREIADFIQSVLPNDPVLINDKTAMFPQELGIYLPSKKIAIEAVALFYHSEVLGKRNRMYHLHKTNACMMKGIRLVQVFENEWTQKREIVKSVLKNLLGLDGTTLFGRKTVVREIDADMKALFLEANHLQGNDRSSVKLGLFHDQQMVAVMTFIRSRFDKRLEWEMSRFCTLLDHRVIGGASKMLAHFVKSYQPKSIVSYSDRRYFGGELYLKLGMSFAANTPPNYWYILDNYDTVRNRVSWQKSMLKDRLLTFDASKSEWKNMQANGFDRIWDCGYLKFVWRPPAASLQSNALCRTLDAPMS